MGKRNIRTMVNNRTAFQGVVNIIRFNWHFYVLVLLFVLFSTVLSYFYVQNFKIAFRVINVSILTFSFSSLFISYLIYDYSSMYEFKFIQNSNEKLNLATINAGFDETSMILQRKFKNSNLQKLDFYDPKKHTEISIKRARKIYPASKDTIQIQTAFINFPHDYFDKIFLIFSAHEIRNEAERIVFFLELKRILKENGEIIILEHVRNTANFSAYFIGFFHFYAAKTWKKIFIKAGLKYVETLKINPFIYLYKLSK